MNVFLIALAVSALSAIGMSYDHRYPVIAVSSFFVFVWASQTLLFATLMLLVS